jgi:hypothetical protein
MKDRMSDILSMIAVVALLAALFIQRADINDIKEELTITSDRSIKMYVCLGLTETRTDYFTCIRRFNDKNEIDDTI